MRHAFAILLSVSVLVFFSGCDKGGTTTTPATSGTASTTDHDHEHGEGHDHGDHDHAAKSHPADKNGDGHDELHGGHPIDFGDAPLTATWNHNDDVTEVFVLTKDGSADLPIKAESITIRTKTGNEQESFSLPAQQPAEDGTCAHFRLDDQKLRLAMTLGVELEIPHDGQTYKATIPPHAAHDH